jgi:hypothetical protein
VPSERLSRKTRTGITVWDQVDVPQRRCAVWRFAPRSIWVERVDNEWHALSQTNEGSGAEAAFIERTQKPTSSQWRHYLHTENAPVQPAPVLPDRPVVVRPDRSLTLLPGENALFFVQIPVWFRLSCAGSRRTRIFEEPISTLSQTWFGDPITGELCYGLATRLHQGLDSIEPSAFLAVCPLSITNDSETDLAFEKICLHVENLSVFRLRSRSCTLPPTSRMASRSPSAPGSPPRGGTSGRPSACSSTSRISEKEEGGGEHFPADRRLVSRSLP